MITTYLVPNTYLTIGAAEAALPADLLGTGIHEIVITVAGEYPETLALAGQANPSAADFVRIRSTPETRHNGIYETGVILQSNNVFIGLDIRTSFTEILDIQFSSTGSSYANLSAFACSDVVVNRCLSKNGFVGFQIQNTSSTVINCVAKDGSNANFIGSLGVHEFYGCIAYSGTRGFKRASSTTRCFNCAGVSNNLNRDFEGTISGSNNISTDGTAPGTNPLINQTIGSMNFVSAGIDFHITAGSILEGAGLPQTDIYNEDIDGSFIDPALWPVGYDYLPPDVALIQSGKAQLTDGPLTVSPLVKFSGKVIEKSAEIQTVDATQTVLAAIHVEEGQAYNLRIKAVGNEEDDANRASYEKVLTVYRPVAGSAIQQGATTSIHEVESDAAWDLALDVAPDAVRVLVTGVAAKNIEWGCTSERESISS